MEREDLPATDAHVGQPPHGAGADDHLDEPLLAALRAAAAVDDPAPPAAVLAARSSLAYLRMDAELAALAFDSLEATADDRALAGTRGAALADRQLTFAVDDIEIEVEIIADAHGWRLVGQCVPATPAKVAVRRPGRVVEVAADDLGRFSVDVEAGPLSLRCTVLGPPPRTIETAWVVL